VSADGGANESRELCLSLLKSETEDEVVQVLQRAGYWTDRSVWRAYGDITNNRGVVGNQQSSPVAALVEKLVNSIDALLLGECLAEGVDPTGPEAPRTMHLATEELFDVPGGQIERLTATERTKLAERIQLVACGTKDQPAYMVIDDGEGQTPESLPTTFLSLLRENKTRIPFVQGKYNMGGTGVLQFAGAHSFQLVISRRQPDIAGPQGATESNRWGFTIVRRLDPGPDQPQSMYVYLAPNNEILGFPGGPLNVLPGAYPELYVEPMEAGSAIKIWNYKFPGRLKTIATLDLRYALEEHLQDPALPIRIRERRPGYRAHTYDTTMSGLGTLLADSKGRLEPGFDTGGSLTVPGVGAVNVRLVVSKEDESDRKIPSGILFGVNGQLHGQLPPEFFARRTKLEYVASSVLVIVDCTDFPARIREDLFLASRDRMRQCAERFALEEAITNFLGDHPGLRQLNNDRRQARLASKLTDDEPARIVQALARADPTLAAIFGKGGKIKIPGKDPVTPVPYGGKQYPTYFRLSRAPKGEMVKQCPRNRSCRIEFETDAANDYLSRTVNPGRLTIKGAPVRLSESLWNGKLTLRFSIPDTASVKDVLHVTTELMDVSRDAPFQSLFSIEVEPDAPPGTPGGPPAPPGAKLLSMPNIRDVRREKWADFGFNENSAIRIRSGDDDTLDFYINMDNINLRNEIAKRRDRDPKLLEYWFKYGIFLLALGMIYRGRHRSGADSDSDGEPDDGAPGNHEVAELACEGLAVTLIPTIAQLSGGTPPP
jgi:hypothetical protein